MAMGSSTVFLQSLAYMVELDEQFPILDFNGTEIGQLAVSLVPCNPSGKEILGEYVENPNEMVGIENQRKSLKNFRSVRIWDSKLKYLVQLDCLDG